MNQQEWKEIRGRLQTRHSVPGLPDAAAFQRRLCDRLRDVPHGLAPAESGHHLLLLAVLVLAGAGLAVFGMRELARGPAGPEVAGTSPVESLEVPVPHKSQMIVQDPKRRTTMVLISGLPVQ